MLLNLLLSLELSDLHLCGQDLLLELVGVDQLLNFLELFLIDLLVMLHDSGSLFRLLFVSLLLSSGNFLFESLLGVLLRLKSCSDNG